MTDIKEIEDRFEVNILGRNLGTAFGWDGEPSELIWFYDFEPRDGIALEKGVLQVNFIKGEVGMQNDDGEVSFPLDIISFLSGVSRNV